MEIVRRLLLVCLIASVAGCKQETADKSPSAKSADETNANHAKPDEGLGHGMPIALGRATIGAFDVRASRDAGVITPGGEAPIDVWLTGDISKVNAVRFWVGTKTGTESIKARADIENKSEPNHWHTHAEIPDPLPKDSRLWVEIETSGSTGSASFDLSMSHNG